MRSHDFQSIWHGFRVTQEFNVTMTPHLEKGVAAMCNLSEGIERRGEKRGRKLGEEVGEKRGWNLGNKTTYWKC